MFKGKPKLKNIFLAGFLVSLHFALTAYVTSSFLSSFVDEKIVGLLYALGSVTSILVLIIAPKILDKMGGHKFLLLVALFDILSLLLLAVSKNALIVIPVFILYFVLNILIIFALDELIEIFSKDSSTGKIRGLYLTVANGAWVIAQITSGKIVGGFSFQTIYFIASFIMILFFLVALFSLKSIPDPKYDKTRGINDIKIFFREKNLARAYKMSFLLQFFYSWMVIYTPIYLHAHLGFDWKEIGIIFAIMLLPFVLIQFPLGKYSDRVGEKKMLFFGFAIATLSTFSLFFIRQHEVWIWALLLFTTRIGAAAIEVMSDIYFFKHIKPENDEFVSIYRNASPLAYILGPLSASILFLILPTFNFIFLALGCVMLYGVYLSSTIERGDF